jgi:hypothetical protein
MTKRAIEIFSQVFDGQWGSAGPDVLTKVLKEICNFKREQARFNPKVHTKENCHGVEVRNFTH